MTDREIDRIADRMVNQLFLKIKYDDELLNKVAKCIIKNQKPQIRFVNTQDAANIIGISKSRLYRIKDYPDGRPRFSYIKSGKSKSCTLKFNANTLIAEYERYVAEQNSK